MRYSDFESTANRMRNRARSGEHRGGLEQREFAYIEHCRTRVGNTILIFTYDAGQHGTWFADPALDRCWHLSISGWRDDFERDAWLRAFFGEHLENVWGAPPESRLGEEDGVWHWRLFCDDRLRPFAAEAHEGELRAEGLRPARELGVAIVLADLAA